MNTLSGTDLKFPLVATLSTLNHRSTYRIPWHSHGTMELQYILSGALTYEFRQGPSMTIPGGSFFIVPSDVEHRAANDEGAPSMRLGILFNAPSRATTLFTPYNARELAEVFARFSANILRIHRQSTDGARVARSLFKIVESDHASIFPPRVRQLVGALIVETDAAFSLKEPLSGDVVRQLKDWIREHCAEPIRITDLVRHSGYSRTRLFTMFADEAGLSPNDWLARCRVERAQRRLQGTRDSITDIAMACGFSSSAYFASVFRRYTGRTPRDFRRFHSFND